MRFVSTAIPLGCFGAAIVFWSTAAILGFGLLAAVIIFVSQGIKS